MALTLDTRVNNRIAPPPSAGRISRKRMRGWLYQIALVVVIALIAVYALQNLEGNLASRGVSVGFDFLRNEAGFAIAFSIIPYAPADNYARVFVVGILNTLLAAGLGIVFATILGFAIGIARLSSNWALSRGALFYVELVRNLPLLLHLLFWYNVVIRTLPPPSRALSLEDIAFLSNRGVYLPAISLGDGGAAVLLALVGAALLAIPAWLLARVYRDRTGKRVSIGWPLLLLAVLAVSVAGWLGGATWQIERPALRGFNFVGGVTILPELAAIVAALALYNASFIAELVRGSIQAVVRGQSEAATALGLRRGQTLRLVVIPQALRVLVPPLTNQYLHLLKASSLATVIGYPDLVNVFTGTALNQTGRAIEIVLMTMAVYLAMSAVISFACGTFNHMTRIVER